MHIQFHFSNLLALFVVLAVVVFFVLFSVVTSVCMLWVVCCLPYCEHYRNQQTGGAKQKAENHDCLVCTKRTT